MEGEALSSHNAKAQLALNDGEKEASVIPDDLHGIAPPISVQIALQVFFEVSVRYFVAVGDACSTFGEGGYDVKIIDDSGPKRTFRVRELWLLCAIACLFAASSGYSYRAMSAPATASNPILDGAMICVRVTLLSVIVTGAMVVGHRRIMSSEPAKFEPGHWLLFSGAVSGIGVQVASIAEGALTLATSGVAWSLVLVTYALDVSVKILAMYWSVNWRWRVFFGLAVGVVVVSLLGIGGLSSSALVWCMHGIAAAWLLSIAFTEMQLHDLWHWVGVATWLLMFIGNVSGTIFWLILSSAQ